MQNDFARQVEKLVAGHEAQKARITEAREEAVSWMEKTAQPLFAELQRSSSPTRRHILHNWGMGLKSTESRNRAPGYVAPPQDHSKLTAGVLRDEHVEFIYQLQALGAANGAKLVRTCRCAVDTEADQLETPVQVPLAGDRLFDDFYNAYQRCLNKILDQAG